mgnify:FL=1|jgi:O-antigen/teichoic acid export membrane protein
MTVKKKFLSNLLGVGLIDGLNLLIPLLTIPILSRVLGPREYGVYLLILTIVTFGYTFIDYSSNYVGVRKLAQAVCNEKRSDIFVNNFAYRIIFSILYVVIALLVAITLYETTTALLVLFIGGPYLVGYALMNTWFFIGTSNTYPLAYVSIIAKIIHLAIVVIFVNDSGDLNIALHSLSIPTLIAGVVLFITIVNQNKLKRTKLVYVLKELKEGSNVFIGLLAPNLYNALPLIIIAAYYSKLDYALLAAAIKIASVIFIIQNVIAKAIFPILSADISNHLNKILLGNVFVATSIFVSLLIFGEWTIAVFLGGEYVGASSYLNILAISAIFVGIANTYGQGYLLAKGKDQLYRNITLYSSVFSCVLMTGFISYLGLLGFVIGVLFARVLISLCLFTVYYTDEAKIVR